jgi:replicative DNA helicase
MTTQAEVPYDVLGLINHDAERTVLAAMRRDSTAATEVIDKLQPLDFYDVRRQVAFEALANLLMGPEHIDTDAIVNECRKVADVRGLKYTITADDIESLVSDNENVLPAAVTVHKLAWLRRAGEFAFDMVSELQTRPDPEDLYSWAMERWQHIAPELDDVNFVYGWDTQKMHRDVIKTRIAEREAGQLVQYTWPWTSWGRMVRPLRGGFVGILAAADGMGKTTYLEQIAEHWSEQGIQTIYVHLEDALDYKLDRRLARNAHVPIDVIEDANLSQDHKSRINDAYRSIGEWTNNLHYYHAAGLDMTTIIRELESKVREGICQAVVFDYLDKVAPTRSQSKLFGDNIWERQGHDMERLKTFAEQNNIPVLTATQGNKTMQNSGTQTRQSIQGSGQKSQKSQLVIIISRDIVGEDGLRDAAGTVIAQEGEYSPIVNVRIDKQNRGKTGQFNQVLVGQYFSVADVERKQQEAQR